MRNKSFIAPFLKGMLLPWLWLFHRKPVVILSDIEANEFNSRALASDWQAIGSDLQWAIDKYASTERVTVRTKAEL